MRAAVGGLWARAPAQRQRGAACRPDRPIAARMRLRTVTRYVVPLRNGGPLDTLARRERFDWLTAPGALMQKTVRTSAGAR